MNENSWWIEIYIENEWKIIMMENHDKLNENYKGICMVSDSDFDIWLSAIDYVGTLHAWALKKLIKGRRLKFEVFNLMKKWQFLAHQSSRS